MSSTKSEAQICWMRKSDIQPIYISIWTKVFWYSKTLKVYAAYLNHLTKRNTLIWGVITITGVLVLSH